MAKSHFSCSIFVLVLLFNLHATSSSISSPHDSMYRSFLRCLANTTNPPPRESVSSIVFSPSNTSFSAVLRSYIRNARFNTSSTPKPILIVTPLLESHVQSSVICANNLGLQLRIRSGGHDFEGLSYVSSHLPFLLLDMSNLRAVHVNAETQTAWVQAGATLGEFYYAIWEKSAVLGFPAGTCPTVGVGGHFSGGGYGPMMRKFGLSVDHIIDARVVDVSGKILDRAYMGEDLFWAIRGGGGASVAVVLSYRVNLVPVPETVTVFRIEKTLEQNETDLVHQWQISAPAIDNDLFMRMFLKGQPETGDPKQGTVRSTISALFLGDSERLVSITGKEFPQLGLKKEDCEEMGYTQSLLWWASLSTRMPPGALLDRNPDSAKFLKRKSDYVRSPIGKQELEMIWKNIIDLDKVELVLSAYGGAMSEIPAAETPFPHRAGNLYKIQYSVNWREAGEEAEREYIGQARRMYDYMTPFVSKKPRSAYFNYRDLDIGVTVSDNGGSSYEEGRVYGVKYFGDNFDRLVRVKTMVDPYNFFRNEQSIPTLPN